MRAGRRGERRWGVQVVRAAMGGGGRPQTAPLFSGQSRDPGPAAAVKILLSRGALGCRHRYRTTLDVLDPWPPSSCPFPPSLPGLCLPRLWGRQQVLVERVWLWKKEV